MSFADSLILNDDDSRVYQSGISGGSLFYKPVNRNNQTFKIYVPAATFLEPLLAYQKDELFKYYPLIGKLTGLIYSDPRLSINTNLVQDSLVVQTANFFSRE